MKEAEVVDVTDAAATTAESTTEAFPAADGREEETACAKVLMQKLGVDKNVAMRFSVARKGDLKKAEPFLAEDLKWRVEFKPESIKQADIGRLRAATVGLASVGSSRATWDLSHSPR